MGSLSDNPLEHNQHIDFNDFRKKRDANDHEWVHPSTVTYHDKRIAGVSCRTLINLCVHLSVQYILVHNAMHLRKEPCRG